MRIRLIVAFSVALAASAVLRSQSQGTSYDLVIKNGRLVDGTGNPWYRGDIGVRGDTIERIAPGIDTQAARKTIDAEGLVVAPGFIDLHVHATGPPPTGILELPTADNYVHQGVTTLVTGPDGSSPIPLKPFLREVASKGITPNLGTFVGQGSIREEVVGTVNRAPAAGELDSMRDLVRQGMRDGAFGLSSGLFYVPGTFTPASEVAELAKIAGSMGGIYISHMRDEASKVVESTRETIQIGETAGLPAQVTHHKVIGKANWGRTIDTLKLIDEARRRGADVTLDVYPYTASATSIQSALLPAWALEGGRAETLKRLQDPVTRRRIRLETVRLIQEERGGGDPQNVQLSLCDWDLSLSGKRLGDVTQSRGFSPSIENAADTVLWIVEQGGCGGIYHAINEQDLQRVLQHPASMVASDGTVVMFGRGNPHPRSYGTFVRVLGRYVRDLKVLTLEEAVRKMSAFPAQRIGLKDRGLLREGMKADIVIFDPATVRDAATFENPHRYAEGVTHVIINGQITFEDGRMTGARPGRALFGPAASN